MSHKLWHDESQMSHGMSRNYQRAQWGLARSRFLSIATHARSTTLCASCWSSARGRAEGNAWICPGRREPWGPGRRCSILALPVSVGRLAFGSRALPVTVSTPQKGRSKLNGGIPLDELLAAHAAGRPVRAAEKTPARAPLRPNRRNRAQRKPQDGVCRAGMMSRSTARAAGLNPLAPLLYGEKAA